MSDLDSSRDGLRLLVCGSRRFEDQRFVWSMLDTLDSELRLGCLITGSFSGADSHARSWAETHQARLETFTPPDSSLLASAFFEADRAIPDRLIASDPRFRKARESLQRLAPQALLTIPDPDGHLGPASSMLARAAASLGLPVINGAEAFAFLRQGCSAPQPA